MRPTLSDILGGGAYTLGMSVAPYLDAHAYAKGSAATVMMLLICAAQEADRAAETLVRENAALRALFADAAREPLSADLAARLQTALAEPDPGLRLSALEAANAALKTQLIALHEAVEAEPADWARTLETRIWTLLVEGAEARAVALPPL